MACSGYAVGHALSGHSGRVGGLGNVPMRPRQAGAMRKRLSNAGLITSRDASGADGRPACPIR